MYSAFLDLEEMKGPHLVHVWPVPYQGTVSYGSGTKNGPEAILRASYQIETFDPQLSADISDLCSFVTLPFQRPNVAGPDRLHQEMDEALNEYDPAKDFFLTLGGEHSIALPLIRFYAAAYPDLTVIQIDAHADLRPEYQGSPFSHGCIMSRVGDLGLKTVALGTRSMDREQFEIINNSPDQIMNLYPWALPGPAEAAGKVRSFIGSGPVYITFDADGLDPSIMPGTGTPEPGGLDYNWLSEFWKNFWPGPGLVGMDFCELAPQAGNVVSESVGVKCILKILLSYFRTVDNRTA